MHIWDCLAEGRSINPNGLAVVDRDWRLTWDQVWGRTTALARALGMRGVHFDDRVAICDFNSHAFLETTFAVAGLGAVLVPINHRLSPVEIAAILDDAGARVLLANATLAAKIEATLELTEPDRDVIWIDALPARTANAPSNAYDALVLEPVEHFRPMPADPDDTAQLYYTSGTTGRPKGVRLTHRNLCTHAETSIAELGLSVDDVWGHVAPMFHLADAWATLAITRVGGRHVMIPRFDPAAVLTVFEQERISLTNLIPTMLNLVVKHPQVDQTDKSSLRVVLSGGAPIAPALVEQTMATLGCDYIQTYGMTETSPFLTLGILPDHLETLAEQDQLAYKAKTGRPFPGVDLKVVDEQGRPVAPDGQQVGEILVRGETVSPGYWNRPDEDERAFEDGWLKTGDLAVIDAEGFVDIVDRKKDMIITGGENVYSTEIENALYRHPDVLEAAAYGVPDPEWGEAVRAAVVLKPARETTAQDLIAFCKLSLAGFKVPKGIVFLDELPRTGSGKIRKQTLREDHC